jgi:hypothetical protein
MAIEVVKQKTKFMRTMRLMQHGDSIRPDMFDCSDGSDSEDDDASTSSELSVMSAPPRQNQSSDSEVDEAPEVLAFLQNSFRKPVGRT